MSKVRHWEVLRCLATGGSLVIVYNLVVILQALACRPHRFRERRGVWFIDNVLGLVTLIRGRSDSPDLEVRSGIIMRNKRVALCL